MVIRYIASNGVRVLLERIPSVRSVSIGIWVATGSRYEHQSNNGISHFIEHMLFKGTKKRNARQIAEAFDRIGGQVNAFTSKECTCYYAKVMDRDASFALNVLADMFFNSRFDEDELAKEKQVVDEEIKMYEDTPDDLVHDLLSEITFAHHPLGFPILGTERTLADFQPDDLKTYMHRHYTPQQIVVSIAGNVAESFIDEVDRLFCPYRAPATGQRQAAPHFFPGKIARRKETEQAHICFGYEGVSNSDDEVLPLMVMNNALGGGMSSRLFQEVREKCGLAYSVFSFHTAYKDSGLLTIYGGTGSARLGQLGEAIQRTIRKMLREGLTDRELSSSKQQIKGSILFGLESTNNRMTRNAKNELILGRDRSVDEIIGRIDAVTQEEVQDVAQKIFTKPYSCSIVSPTGEMPTAI